MLKYFPQNLNMLKSIVIFAINTENLKKQKYHIFFLKKHEVFLLFLLNVVMNMNKYLKKKSQLKY